MNSVSKARRSPGIGAALPALLAAAGLLAVPSNSQAPPVRPAAGSAAVASRENFRAEHYEIDAKLDPSAQRLSAHARVDLVAQTPSRVVEVELHSNLRLNSVTTSTGKPVQFERDTDSPLVVRITLPDPVPAGQAVTLSFDYAGLLAKEENSAPGGVGLAYIGPETAYLLQPARWFPLTGYPSNRYTAVFNLEVPEDFAVAGTGTSEAPGLIPAAPPAAPLGKAPAASGKPQPQKPAATARHLLYKFVCDRPEAAGTFVAGNIQLSPVSAQGMQFSVFARPADAPTAAAYANSLGQIITFFSAEFGPIPQPNLTLIQVPATSVPGFAAPGVLLVSQQQWTPRANDRLLAQLAAEQWWGVQVMPATLSDVWLSDGLSQYSAALWVEHADGREALHRALGDFSVGALMDEEAAPIAQAAHLAPFTTAYRSVVMDKGAVVFHMLRSELGDENFGALLRDYYVAFAGKAARLDDFERLAKARTPPPNPSTGRPPLNLPAFFAQWLNSTGIPEFQLEYIIYRTQKGFKVVGKVKQDLETFNMPVEVRVETEGNPEYKMINVVGPSSEFTLETFGRPKPNGIALDPNNNLLKSSPKLRVRAIIARGEELAANGQLYEAIQRYQKALDIQKNNSLALFRMGEAMFFQKNYQAAATSFRDALEGDLDPTYKWVEVWSHIYLGKIFDLSGLRDRALNEYQKAQQTHDDTGGAQAEANRFIRQPYSTESQPRPSGS